MATKQVQQYCQDALRLAAREGNHAGLAFLIGEKFGSNISLLRKARQKLQFLYPRDETPADHPLNLGGRALKMSYAMTVQEHYAAPLEQVKHLESLLADFVAAIRDAFSQRDIKNYLDSSPALDICAASRGTTKAAESEAEFSADDLLSEADEILVLEDIRKLLLREGSG